MFYPDNPIAEVTQLGSEYGPIRKSVTYVQHPGIDVVDVYRGSQPAVSMDAHDGSILHKAAGVNIGEGKYFDRTTHRAVDVPQPFLLQFREGTRVAWEMWQPVHQVVGNPYVGGTQTAISGLGTGILAELEPITVPEEEKEKMTEKQRKTRR